jgi:hypothetical protein
LSENSFLGDHRKNLSAQTAEEGSALRIEAENVVE